MGKKEVVDLSIDSFRKEWEKADLSECMVNIVTFKKRYLKRQMEIFDADPTWEGFDEMVNCCCNFYLYYSQSGLNWHHDDLVHIYRHAFENVERLNKIYPITKERALKYLKRAATYHGYHYLSAALLRAVIGHENIGFAYKVMLQMIRMNKHDASYNGIAKTLIDALDSRFNKEFGLEDYNM